MKPADIPDTMKNIDLGKISVPLDDYASQGNAILGIRDSGKSYTATSIAERLMDAGIPIIAFDPIGIWRYLRVPGTGKGYEVVVAGGKQGDLPLSPRSAQELIRAAMRENVSLVVDLYDIHLSKSDWREVVASSIRTLLYENGEHGLRHIFIEEAAEFCPQVIAPDQGRVYAEVEKLARMGGNALLGYTLINQRAEQVNKAVLELCDCLILHRQKGRNSINALTKWLDLAAATRGNDIARSLPMLGQGECWVWPAGSDSPVRTKVPGKHSFHPDRRARQAPAKSERQVDVSGFVATMKETLEAVVKEAEANDPKRLRARISELERGLKKGHGEDPRAALDYAHSLGWISPEERSAMHEEHGRQLRDFGARVVDAAKAMQILGEQIDDRRNNLIEHYARARPTPVPQVYDTRHTTPSKPLKPRPAGPGVALPRAERQLLTVLAQRHPKPASRSQLSILSGYSLTSSSFSNALSALRSQGYCSGYGDDNRISEAGLKALGEYEPLPTGRALVTWWLSRLPKAESTFLEYIAGRYPSAVSKEELAGETGYSITSSSYSNALSKLRTLELIQRGEIKASADLFE